MGQYNNLNEDSLFETSHGLSYQCDVSNSIIIHFKGTIAKYKVRDFLIFQRKVNSVAILDMLYDLSDQCDSKLIEATKRNFSRNLTICEIVQLRELLNGTKFSLTLYSMLNEVLNEVLV